MIFFQGVRVETAPEAGVRVLAEGKNLVLQGIRRFHAGNYTCSAFNLEGEDTSNVLNVRVMCKFQFFVNFKVMCKFQFFVSQTILLAG
jgi:hypothetical protein